MKFPLFIFGSVVVLFMACKKDRTCSCTVTKSGTSTTKAAITASTPFGNLPIADTSFTTNIFEVQIVDKKMKHVSKHEGKYNCISYSEPYNENQVNVVPNFNLTTNSQGTRDYSCSLK